MATSYSDRLKNFASAIIAEDMSDGVLEKQQQLFGPCVRNKLPVDTVSKPGKCIFFSQLIETRGDIGVKIYKKCCACYSSDSQDQAIFASSAASGTGKTHGVYAAGKHMFSLVIRVGTSSDEINGGAVLSSPWEELVKTITAIREYYLRQNEVDGVPVSFEKCKECAHYAYTCIKLLVSCYMAVSIDALRLVTSPSLSEAQQREFLLSFHRNCISEDLVRERFLCELDFHRNSYTSECHLLDAESVNNFCNGLEMSFSQQVLICFDEIPALKDYFPKLFIDSDTYLKNDEPEPGDASIHRGLLYAVACCMVSLSNSTKWSMLMTGTSFSLTQLSCSGQGLSPVRGCVEAVSPDKILDVSDMQALLQYYFNLSDGTLEDVAVVSMLKRCCGRPHIFVNIVLKRIFDTLLF